MATGSERDPNVAGTQYVTEYVSVTAYRYRVFLRAGDQGYPTITELDFMLVHGQIAGFLLNAEWGAAHFGWVPRSLWEKGLP